MEEPVPIPQSLDIIFEVCDQRKLDFSITANQITLETKIKVSYKDGKRMTISTPDFSLCYAQAEFEHNASAYLARQREQHQGYTNLVRDTLHEEYGDLNKLIEHTNDLNRIGQFLNEDTMKTLAGFAKAWLKIDRFLKGESGYENAMTAARQQDEWLAQAYTGLEYVTGKGKEFFENLQAKQGTGLSEQAAEDLKSCAKLVGDLHFMYRQLASVHLKRIKYADEFRTKYHM